MWQILIEELMTKKVKCASPATPLSEVVQSMRANHHSCIIIAESEKPVGILTERDIVTHFSAMLEKGKDHDPPAAAIMSSPPVTVEAKTTLFEALVVSRCHEIRHLPVTDANEKLIGLVTQTDLVTAHFRTIQAQTDSLERAVAQRTQELMEVNDRLRALTLEDGLLRIGNRRAMEVDLAHTHAAARRYHRPYAIMLCDLDHFKLYNDHYGHPAGDRALREITAVIRQTIRHSDRVYRYGGEELLLLFPETTAQEAEGLGQKLLHAVAQRALPHLPHPMGIMTLSAGVSYLEEASVAESWRDLLQMADWALYEAKSSGRNRVVLFAAAAPGPSMADQILRSGGGVAV
jgi:diguanylate cyclase (GGDEF)-like protein